MFLRDWLINFILRNLLFDNYILTIYSSIFTIYPFMVRAHKNRKQMVRRAWVWRYFHQIDEDRSQCNYCIASYRNSTTKFKYHLLAQCENLPPGLREQIKLELDMAIEFAPPTKTRLVDDSSMNSESPGPSNQHSNQFMSGDLNSWTGNLMFADIPEDKYELDEAQTAFIRVSNIFKL